MTYPVPYFAFTTDDGIELSEFNTIRLGVAWSKRLKKGDRVLLAYKHCIVNSARVTYVDCGPINEMLAKHAANNHCELAMRTQPGYDVSQAPVRRWASMVRNYGPQKINDATKITVIGLKPLKTR